MFRTEKQKQPWPRWAALLSAVFAFVFTTAAAPVPAPEKLLPDDTLFMVTAPDVAKLKALYLKSPQYQFLNDPAMRPFRDKFLTKWQDGFVKPLERELGLSLDDYWSLLQGQLTMAITQNGWQGKPDQPPGYLLLLDTKEKGSQLKTNLAELRRKWVDAGKPIRTEKIREVEFSVLPMSSNDVPKTLRKFMPQTQEVQELGAEKETKKAPASELFIGQVESLLILSSSAKAADKVVARATGGSVPPLAELAAYQANHLALFRDSPFYAWANTKAFMDIISRLPEKKENPEAPNPFDLIKTDKILSTSGIAGVRSLAFSVQAGDDGFLMQVFAGVPETSRSGLFKLFPGEPKEATPPPFVPADTVKFQRWRLDGQKAWATLEKMLNDLSPSAVGSLNWILDTASAKARETDPAFDLKKGLIGNLGDDMITCERTPRGNSSAERDSPPSLFLLGSPQPEKLASALKGLFVIFPQNDKTTEREFLGRKVYSLPQPAMPMIAMGDSGRPAPPRTLSYAAASGYVAFSTDVAMLEQFLRSSESSGKVLRETPGLTEAAQKVTGSGTGLFGYENETESMRVAFESLRTDAGSKTANAITPLADMLNISGPDTSFKDWMDFALLPPFDKVAKYFHFSVYGGSASVEGLWLKMFAPVPPQLKAAPPATPAVPAAAPATNSVKP